MIVDVEATTPRPHRRVASVSRTSPTTVRYCLNVIAVSVPELVRHAGGWLADCAWAGWDVNAYVIDTADDTPLRILGATPHRFTAIRDAEHDFQPPTVLAISAADADAEPHLATMLRDELNSAVTEIAIWGGSMPDEYRGLLEPVEHRLSGAAQAFKQYALRAVGIDELAAPLEFLHTAGRFESATARPCRPGTSSSRPE